MKKLICLLLTLCLAMTGMTIIAAAEEPAAERPLTTAELPDGHWAAFEAEMASAYANARSRAPGQAQYALAARDEFNGYTGTKADGSLSASFTVTDAVVPVGQEVIFYVNLACSYPPMVYTVGGLVMDENFQRLGSHQYNGGESFEVNADSKAFGIKIGLDFPGYFNFVVVVSDGVGNRIALTTPTIQVYDKEKPPFTSVGTDQDIIMETENSLGVLLEMDKKQTKVGHPVTANVTLSTRHDPVKYTGTWTLKDEAGNVVETLTQKVTGEVNAQAEKATIAFDYKPLQAGRIQFSIDATDGAGNHVNIDAPHMTVEDGFYIETALNRAVMNVGKTTRGTYTVYGHTCESIYYFLGWECYDAEGNLLESRRETLTEASGSSLYTPRIGDELVFYAGAGCEHHAATYQQDTLLLVGSIDAEIWPLTVTAQSGSEVGAGYSVSGGLEPYQKITIIGVSTDSISGERYTFMEKTVTETEGTVFGRAHLGDAVHFEIRVTEEDGYTSTWASESIPMSEAPAVTTPTLTASVSPRQLQANETVTLTWKMVGGSGTINKLEPENSYVRWTTAEGDVLSEELIDKISGTADFTPEADGDYLCVLVLTDGYNQQVKWTSEAIRVRTGRTPGDANQDGAVNIMDALLTLQYSVGWSVDIHTGNADVDGHGGVSIMDALLILQYSVGWDVSFQ